ncbi:hydrogen peroxide-inducible genes activator [Sphingomonas sp.]|uniref:hydrogen peroxide-inducible genes activator n=1 Tax=Sphingomonas sp. TaxID=28214 RepID=UPI003B3A3D26
MQRLRLTARQLSYFVAVAETGGFTRAAEKVGVSQPSLSQQIRTLEEVIGGPLLERGGPPLPTPLGREVLERARRILLDMRDLEDVRAIVGDGLTGTIRLGVSPTLGAYILPAIVARLHREHPSLRVHIREGLPAILGPELLAGAHDMVLAQLPVPGANLHCERLFREPLLLAMAADHPLHRKSAIAPADLAGQPLLTLLPEYRLSEQVTAIAAETGAILLRDYEGTSLDAVRQMAGMGVGLTLLPERYVRQEVREGDDVVVRPFTGSRYYRDIGLLWRQGAGRAPAFHLIADYLRADG